MKHFCPKNMRNGGRTKRGRQKKEKRRRKRKRIRISKIVQRSPGFKRKNRQTLFKRTTQMHGIKYKHDLETQLTARNRRRRSQRGTCYKTRKMFEGILKYTKWMEMTQ